MITSRRFQTVAGILTVCLLVGLVLPTSGTATGRTIQRNPDAGAGPPTVAGSDWSLIIGIDEYADPEIPDLSTAVNDARAVADLLTARMRVDPGRMIELYNDNATRAGIITALDRLSLKVKTHDRVLIYYAGHGEIRYRGKSSFEVRDPKVIQEMKQYGMGFWIPATARLGATAGYLSNAELRTYFAQIDADHLLVVSDSCYSGGMTERGFNPRYPEKPVIDAMRLRSRLLLASGGLHPVPDRSRLRRCAGHSTFACYFLKFLAEAPAGYVTTRGLYAQLYEPVVSNADQEPLLDKFQMMGHEGGQFVFILDEPDDRSRLTVESNVSGAWVRLGGDEIGRTPLTDAPVEPGDYRLTMGKDGYETERRSISIDTGRHSRLFVHLKPDKPETARLFVHTEPSGARVRILNIGPAFRQGMALAPGRYEVEASADGCETRTRWVSVSAGRDEYVDLVL